MKFIQLSTQSGHVFQIPVDIIAGHRAKVMQELHPGEFATLEAALEDTTELFNEDSWNIQDWAQNNMNWPDIRPHAKLIRFTPPVGDTWFEGEWKFTDHPSMMEAIDGDNVLTVPVEVLLASMIDTKQLCNITLLNNEQGEPYAAMATVIGDKQVIGTYVQALQLTTGVVAAQLQAPDPAADQAIITH